MDIELLKRPCDKHCLEQVVWWLNNPEANWKEIRTRLDVLFPGANFSSDSVTRRATLKKAIKLRFHRLVEQQDRLNQIVEKTDVQRDKLSRSITRTPIVVPGEGASPSKIPMFFIPSPK